jgi:pyrroloquinoline quinone biosynthesis protein B
VLGLFSLRESHPLSVYATASVRRGLEENAMLRTLCRFDGQLVWRDLKLGEPAELLDAAGETIGITILPLAAKGKLPVHLVGFATPSAEDNVALVVRGKRGRSAMYATACASLDGLRLPGEFGALLFDGTFFRDDELVRLGASRALARDMAHLPIGGPEGSLARLVGMPGRKIYTHVNNTNPILAPGSEERAEVERAGWEVAVDGMEVEVA